MNLNQKIVLLVLGIAFHGGIMGMEGYKKYFVLPNPRENTGIAKKALYVAQSVRNGIRQLDIDIVGNWLDRKRLTIPEKEWPIFVHEFVSAIDKLKILCITDLEKEKLSKMGAIIKEVASEKSMPSEDYSYSFVLETRAYEIGLMNYAKL